MLWAASTLHAMAILQVHQAKALQEMYEGGSTSAEMQELCTATNLALMATKVRACALGRHLWLNLAEMKVVEKVCFHKGAVLPCAFRLVPGGVVSSPQPFELAQEEDRSEICYTVFSGLSFLSRRAFAGRTPPLTKGGNRTSTTSRDACMICSYYFIVPKKGVNYV